jgi:hypothetical protein
MVNNFTNIYKTNNHLSLKESSNSDCQQLSSDGQQLHQYQQITVWTFFKWEVVVCFVDIGEIVDHHCLIFL